MARQKTIFICQSCGGKSPKWIGKCTYCGEWNTYLEELCKVKPDVDIYPVLSNPAKPIQEIRESQDVRWSSTDVELDRALGGGMVEGGITLLAGDPGIGKSTLMLQIAMGLTRRVLYVSGEESQQQIKQRAKRLKINHNQSCYLLAEVTLELIIEELNRIEPKLVVIDSIQTVYSTSLDSVAGSVSQVRACTTLLQRIAKNQGISFFLVGHINKEGNIAGPKVLEHVVDTVLLFEGDTSLSYRMVRTMKNRYGPTAELGVYEMFHDGLKAVANPSGIFISEKYLDSPGQIIGAIIQGTRPLLVEVQALVCPSSFSVPQRSCTGYDLKRLQMLIAVLERRVGVFLSKSDIFINIAGGIKVTDTSLDLAICLAIFSSTNELSIKDKICFIGEVSLGGGLRLVPKINILGSEAYKLGFQKVVTGTVENPGNQIGEIQLESKMDLKDAITSIFL